MGDHTASESDSSRAGNDRNLCQWFSQPQPRTGNWARLVELAPARHNGAVTGDGASANGPRGRDLARLILDDYAAGVRLPPERQLAGRLGVTRAAVRHALGYLEAEGRISREVGRGTFLRSSGEAADDVGPADVMAARELFEPQVVPLVVLNATARDFAELDRCLVGGEAAATADEFERWDDGFHRAIVVAAHNPVLLRMYASIEEARHGPLWGNLKRSHDSPERRALYRADHRRIVDALQARELEQALEATLIHLRHVRANLLGPAGGAVAPTE